MQTQTIGKSASMRGLKALVAAASLGVMAIASHASAQSFTLDSASMNETYDANIVGFGEAISNGVTFQVTGYPGTTSLFAFCIDIYHDMYLGSLNYNYVSNQDTGGGLLPNAGTTLANSGPAGEPLNPLNQISAITNLVDTGFLLNQQSGNDPTTILQLAAIQAAIWAIEVPMTDGQPTVSLVNGGATATAGGETYQQYFNAYSTGDYTSLATPTDRVFTISDTATDPSHQSFAVGWPIPVPEPASWALMITGFVGVGSLVRNQRKRQAAVAA